MNLMERAVRKMQTFGNSLAIPAEMREILSIPQLDRAEVDTALGI